MHYQTKNCNICYKTAVIWCGYVTKGNESITAGWCEEHAHITSSCFLVPCRGEWKDEMGLKPIEEKGLECDCGAKHTRDPNCHSIWSSAYQKYK